ncbi:pentapeptide repeat-containing protein [Streptomyces silvensis]|uniref:pentapeptide repeat-containing protein n=1 Tax=Streptomyces silvensis TaxID=1765722 RepID=UPI000D1AF8EE
MRRDEIQRFRGTRFRGTGFRGTTFRRTKFRGTTFRRTRFRRSGRSCRTDLPLQGARSPRERGRGAAPRR